MRSVLDEAGTDDAECHRKVASRRRVACAICSLVNAWGMQLECARVLHESLLVPVFIYGSKTMLWKQERSTIRAVQMDNPKGLLGIRRMDKVSSCAECRRVDERIYEGVLQWFGHMDRMGNEEIVNRVYVGEYAGSRSWKRWIDTVKERLEIKIGAR